MRQPSWGLGGPHDACRYKEWPHQSNFFHHNGSWASAYGRFFLQWYSEMLAQHANRVMAAACEVRGWWCSLCVFVCVCVRGMCVMTAVLSIIVLPRGLGCVLVGCVTTLGEQREPVLR